MAMFRWGGTSIVSPSQNDWAPNLYAQPETSVLPLPVEPDKSSGFETIAEGALTLQGVAPQIILTVITIITPGTGSGIISIESTTSAAESSGTSYSFFHTVTNANFLLVEICNGLTSAASNRPVANVTFNGVNLSLIVAKDDGNFEHTEIWGLQNPPVGNFNVVANYALGQSQLGGGATGLIGYGSTGSSNTNTGSTANPSVTVDSTSGDMVVSSYASDLGSAGATTENGTLLWELEDVGGGDSDFSAQRQLATGTSTICSWTAIATAPSFWAVAGVALRPAPGVSFSSAAPILRIDTVVLETPSAGALTLTGFAATVSLSGSGQTIIPTVGSLVLTGNQPIQTFTLLPSAGSLTITGQQATPIITFLIIPTAGLLVLTPFAPGILTNILPASGALTITGPPTGITTTIIPGAGTLTLTGIQGTVALATQLTPSTGTLVLTSVAPIVLRTTVIIPSVGSLVLTGTAAGIQTTIIPIIGTLSLTGIAPVETTTIIPSSGSLSLSINSSILTTTIIPSVGSLVLTGFAPSVTKTTLITPSVGSLVLTAASSTVTTTIIPSAGTLVLTGFSAAVPGGPPGTGALILTGAAPQLSSTIFTTAGNLSFVGISPVIIRTTIVSSNAGTLNVVGQQSVLTTTVIPTTGSLAFAGTAPIVITNKFISLQVGALTLTGISSILNVTIIPATGVLTLTGNSPAPFFVPGTRGLNLVGQPAVVAIRSAAVGGFFYFFSLT